MNTIDSKLIPWSKNFTRKRKVFVKAAEKVRFTGLNWSGGSRSEYSAVNLHNGQSVSPNMSQEHPWFNPFEGKEVSVPEGVAIVEHGHFCGKPMTIKIYVNPANMPKLLEKTEI